MRPVRDHQKLPVPGQWQTPVRGAIAHLKAELQLPETAIAVTLVEPMRWTAADATVKSGLKVWLLAHARTYRYRIDLATGGVEAVPG